MNLITYVKDLDRRSLEANPECREGYLYSDVEYETWCNSVCHDNETYADAQFKLATIKYKTLITLLTNWAAWYYFERGDLDKAEMFNKRYGKYNRLLWNSKMTEEERHKVFCTLD